MDNTAPVQSTDTTNAQITPTLNESTNPVESNDVTSHNSEATFVSATPESSTASNVIPPKVNLLDAEGDTNNEYVRPDWLPEKFENETAAAKSYLDLEKRFGSFTGAPKDGTYEFTPSETLEQQGFEYDPTDPDYKRLADLAKNWNMSNEAYNELINFHHETQLTDINESTTQYQKSVDDYHKTQIQQLGTQEIDQFKLNIKSLQNTSIHAKGMNDLLNGDVGADAIKAFNQLCNRHIDSDIPQEVSQSSDSRSSLSSAMSDWAKLPDGTAKERARKDLRKRYELASQQGVI